MERFERIMPPQLSRFFFANSGSEAVDNAIKVARSYTGRQNIIAFDVSLNLACPSPDFVKQRACRSRSAARIEPMREVHCQLRPSLLFQQ